jgi:hypothetical protein
MGHEDGSVQARYSHVTAEMRRQLLVELNEIWDRTLAARRQLAPRSSVATLDRLHRCPVNGKRILTSCRQLKVDHLPVYDSSVVAVGTRPRSRFRSR